MVHIILLQRACVGGRNRADFQNFLTQNRANFNRTTARFRRRKCAQRTPKARRINAHALHAVWYTPATSVKLLQALGACRAQKSRRISSKFSRFSPKIASFCRRLSCKRALAKMGIRDLDESFAIFHPQVAAAFRAFTRMFTYLKWQLSAAQLVIRAKKGNPRFSKPRTS